jgi:hypothetical protein
MNFYVSILPYSINTGGYYDIDNVPILMKIET